MEGSVPEDGVSVGKKFVVAFKLPKCTGTGRRLFSLLLTSREFMMLFF